MLSVTPKIQIPLRELEFTFSRSSGPGGQNVNKVNTKSQLRWRVTDTDALPPAVKERFLIKYRRRITSEGDLLLTSQRFRDRGRNVADCLAKLRELVLAVATAPVARKKTRPTLGSQRRRLAAKQARSEKKQQRKSPRLDD